MIRFLGERRCNTYIYAPKNDPKHRDFWRDAYTAEEKEKFRELDALAKENGVRFTYALSPGLDFDFSDAGYEKDFARLIEKYDSVYQLGIRHFALLLDDLAVRTAETAQNHVRLVNDFRRRFYEARAGLSELICIFAEYYDTILTEDYTGTIARQLNRDVFVMWTGPSIALQMSAASFAVPNRYFGRKMLLWWNYPVNDYCTDHLLADGAQGLSPDLKDAVVGIVSNPMNQAEASKIPLSTLADYMENPEGYRYKESYEKAVGALFPETADSVRMILENLYASQINNYTDSVRFRNLISAFRNGQEGGAAELYAAFEKLRAAVLDIRENCSNRIFVTEIAPWLEKALCAANMGIYFLKAAQAESDKEFKEFWEYFRLFSAEKQNFRENTAVFSGWVLTPFLLDDAPKMLRQAGPRLQSYSGEITVQKTKGAPSASLGCYQNYGIENVNDDSDKTYYWSRSAATEGFWIMLDLGATQNVYNIVLKSGCSPAGLDYIRKGQMQYSTDGKNWRNVGAVQTKKEVFLSGLDLYCRYIRYVSLSKQDFWMSVSEFAVNVTATSRFVTGSPRGEYGREAFRMADGDLFSFYKSERAPRAGERMTFNTGSLRFKKIIVMQSSLCGADVAVTVGGKEVVIGKLDQHYNEIPVPAGALVEQAAFIWKESVVPVIHNVLFI